MPSPRRHFLYLLLFLVPTLVVGGGTLWLLYREQQRINEQTRAAETARLAAIDARARLIAENIELVISDVETGLMTALSEAPRQRPELYLDNWRRTNPLVHNVFMISVDGQSRWGALDGITSQFIAAAPWRDRLMPVSQTETAETAATPGDETVALERFSISSAPQIVKMDAVVPAAMQGEAKETAKPAGPSASAPAAKDIVSEEKAGSDNVTQYQSARLALSQAANINIQSVPPPPAQPADSEKIADSRERKKVADKKYKPPSSSVSRAEKRKTSVASGRAAEVADAEIAIGSLDGRPATVSGMAAPRVQASSPDEGGRDTGPGYAAQTKPSQSAAVVAPARKTAVPQQQAGASASLYANGWTPWTAPDGTQHLYGWWLTSPARPVIVVEVNLSAIASRLGGILPVNIEPGEAYALRQHDNTILHQVGFPGARVSGTKTTEEASVRGPHSSQPACVVPLASTLPAWNVAGYSLLDSLSASHTSNRTFFLLGALLVAAIIATILAGGGLLWRQARLSAAESAQKTSFVANVSHEFKTPLTTIRLYSELLEQGRIRDEAKRAESLRTISRETQRLARLVNNVLDFSRLEQGRKKFDFAEHDLRVEIAKIVERHAPRIAEAGLKLDFVAPPPEASCVVKTDLDAVEQIVINLLDNACKYAAGGGEVTVKVEADVPAALKKSTNPGQAALRSASTFSISVADRGPGIPASQREKIFEKFHRVDDTLTASQGGAGLGLSIARQLARGLGGDLAYSPREGGGGEFTLTLSLS